MPALFEDLAENFILECYYTPHPYKCVISDHEQPGKRLY